MPAEAAPAGEGLPALGTVGGLLSTVGLVVADEQQAVKEGLPTVTALVVSTLSEDFLGWG